MKKISLHKLNLGRFMNIVPLRKKHVDSENGEYLKERGKSAPNLMAERLHPGMQHLVVMEVKPEAPGVVSYILGPDRDMGTKELAYFQAGQYLSVFLDIKPTDSDGSTGTVHVTRPYSLSSSPRESLEGKYMLTVKATGGLVSTYIQENWQVGSRVKVSEPQGTFTYERLRDAKNVVAIAGGSGITPFRSLAKAAADGDEDMNLILLYGTRTMADAVFQNEFKELEKYGKLKLVNVLSSGDEAEAEQNGAEKGFITAELIKKYAPEGEYSVFLCGPQAMYDFADKELEKLNLRRKYIRHELMGGYKDPEMIKMSEESSEEFKLTVNITDKKYETACRSEESILVAMERAGIKAPSRCRSGLCGWCHSQLCSGDVYIPSKTDGRRAADGKFGYIHPCAAFPLSDIEITVPSYRE